MKQLRLLLLMLVACVAQVSHGQDLFETWYEEGLIRERMIPVMLCFNDYQKYFGDIAQSLRGVHKYGSNEVLSVRQKEEYIQRHIDSVKGNLSKWQKKLEKGKSLNFEDALWGALVSQHDGVMAAKYFDAAVKVANDDSTKTILQLASIGCKYSINKDKAAAAAAINFPIPDNCKKVATLIVNKYSMKDISSEAIQQLFNVDKRLITRAIRSNNIEELKKYESYDIPEVDSVLAVKTSSTDLYWKCIMKHKMLWPLKKLDFSVVMSRTDLPANVFKSAFLTPLEEDNEWKYKMLDYIRGITKDKPNRIFGELNNLRIRSDIAALTMAVITNVFVWNIPENRDFFFDLNEYTAQLLGNNESEKAKSVEKINKAYSDYLSINTNGVVKLKIQAPTTAKVVELYEKLANWICSSDIKLDYKRAELPSNSHELMSELENALAAYLSEVVQNTSCHINVFLTVDVDGSVISIDAQVNGNSVWKKGASHNVKMQTKCKPAMRGGQPIKDVLVIKYYRNFI